MGQERLFDGTRFSILWTVSILSIETKNRVQLSMSKMFAEKLFI